MPNTYRCSHLFSNLAKSLKTVYIINNWDWLDNSWLNVCCHTKLCVTMTVMQNRTFFCGIKNILWTLSYKYMPEKMENNVEICFDTKNPGNRIKKIKKVKEFADLLLDFLLFLFVLIRWASDVVGSVVVLPSLLLIFLLISIYYSKKIYIVQEQE